MLIDTKKHDTSIVALWVRSNVDVIDRSDVPFGRAKTPLSEPFWRARLNCAVKTASLTPVRLLLAWTYFLMAWRL